MTYTPRPDIVYQELLELRMLVRQMLTQSPLGYSSISEGALRILSSEGLIVVGSARTTGTQYVDGRLDGSGTFDWTGPMWLRGSVMLPGNLTGVGTMLWSGPWELRGNGDITGDVGIDGDLSLGTGRFLAGPLIIDKAGGYGARVYSTGTLLLDASSNVVAGAPFQALAGIASIGNITTTGHIASNSLDVGPGSKNFRIEHPLIPGHWLRHGSTESPVSGTEYTGRATVGEDGSVEVELPDYFEALNKPDNRTAQITPLGRPFAVGADEVVDGKFTIYGEPGRDVFWLVKAERISGDFPLVEPIEAQ